MTCDPLFEEILPEKIKLVGKRPATSNGVIYAKASSSEHKEIFLFPPNDNDTWHLSLLSREGLIVHGKTERLKNGRMTTTMLANGVIKGWFLPLEQQPKHVQEIVKGTKTNKKPRDPNRHELKIGEPSWREIKSIAKAKGLSKSKVVETVMAYALSTLNIDHIFETSIRNKDCRDQPVNPTSDSSIEVKQYF